MLITNHIIFDSNNKPIIINKEDTWWKLIPLKDKNSKILFDDNGNPIYFRASLNFQNTWSDKNNIHLNFEVIIENDSILPPNFVQSNVSIAGTIYPTLIDLVNEEDNFKTKKAIIKVVVPIEKITTEKFEEGIELPVVIDFYLQKDILDGIKDSLESNALRLLIENLKNSRITTKIKFNNYLFFKKRRGEKEVDSSYENSEKRKLSWYQPNYTHLSDLDQIKELITLNINSVVTVFNYKISFRYSSSVNGSPKSFNISERSQITYPPNTDIKFGLESNYIYDTNTNEILDRGINNHYFFLPNGGEGLYSVQISLLINKVKYDLEAANTFSYFSWLDNQSKLDFIDIFPKVIKSIGSYAIVE
ncbi:DUF5443 family protein [Mycoplasma bradburyae]|uniref:DUF5443 family protein n=1 Tax=Mycoplasma bradburyae TaxID=2963128 RepID=A0ABT5GAU8_9MOLU|nr:DUF5443 family protein [Mycoplasma bradburyae]MDC4182110.1 DUF5443 family protein [Mycoplasma bradburyae]MDC4184296.1 DUF5443 family protein [Mycoplasma bradburyae]UTS70321.1 DUF5443 family protein [Mycoplasma bradburyae]UTS71044.1 DUF5443 family protein [Mycoplasma bradburyae]